MQTYDDGLALRERDFSSREWSVNKIKIYSFKTTPAISTAGRNCPKRSGIPNLSVKKAVLSNDELYIAFQ